jgi:hypothetical protein
VRPNTQPNDIDHNDSTKGVYMTLSKTMLYLNAEEQYAESRIVIAVLNVVMLSVVVQPSGSTSMVFARNVRPNLLNKICFKTQNFNGLKASKCSNKRLVENKSSLLRKNYLQNCFDLQCLNAKLKGT